MRSWAAQSELSGRVNSTMLLIERSRFGATGHPLGSAGECYLLHRATQYQASM